jgi:predicted nucleotidyltransferase
MEARAQVAVRPLARLAVVRAASLFGSHVEGTPHAWSDIDVAAYPCPWQAGAADDPQ